jgi:hypothetical protein
MASPPDPALPAAAPWSGARRGLPTGIR